MSTADPDRLHELKYCIALSVRYHECRERWYDGWDRLAKAIAVIGGAATVGTLLGEQEAKTWVAAAITVSSAISLVFSFSDKARRHFDLRKRYLSLEAELLQSEDLNDRAVERFESRVAIIESEEPPKLSTLVQVCQNQIAQARGQMDHIHRVPFWKYCLASTFDIPAKAKDAAPSA